MKPNEPKLKMSVGVVCLVAVLAVATAGCTQPTKARRVLEQAGYTKVEITGWRPFMAGEGDVFSTGFKAKAPNGSNVSGAVTGGILKGNTIRVD